jgi:hypothetical protein
MTQLRSNFKNHPYSDGITMSHRYGRIWIRCPDNTNWAHHKRVAIAPPYVNTDFKFSVYTPRLLSAFDAFTEYVEKQRLPEKSKGPRSLQNIATDVVLREMSSIAELGDFPKALAKRLWDVLDRRFVTIYVNVLLQIFHFSSSLFAHRPLHFLLVIL